MTNCKKCEGEIGKYSINGIEFGLCKKCGIVIISEENFKKLAAKIDINCKIIDLFALPSINIKKNPIKCEICDDEMEQVYCEGVVIDRCPKCRMLLFDNGELSKYFSIFSSTKVDITSNTAFLKKYCNLSDVPKGIRKEERIEMKIQSKEVEKSVPSANGWLMVSVLIMVPILGLLGFLLTTLFPILAFLTVPLGIIMFFTFFFLINGFKILKPQEALVYTLFGKYYGTLKNAGFYWVNPLASTTLGIISLKASTLDNGQQKINDVMGNPIQVGIIVTWEIQDTAKALFNVNNYTSFLSAQCDSALRNIVRLYPYDAPEDSNIQSLKDDSAEISEKLKARIQDCVSVAGINIIDARITHLAYSSEIAAAMLQRQQANAVIDAKRAIVDGAVGMVEMAIDKLSLNKNINLDEKTKASMVNNLLVVLCSNKDSQPVVRNDLL